MPEIEDWKEWGAKKSPEPEFDPPQIDFSETDFTKIQAEMMKHQTGPAFGFVKLRLGDRSNPETVSKIAMKWTEVARTGSIEAKFMGVDLSTIMFTMEKGQDSLELKEFLLTQPEAYELKIGDQLFRRPGDPPFDDVFQMHHGNKDRVDYTSPAKDDKQQKDEL